MSRITPPCLLLMAMFGSCRAWAEDPPRPENVSSAAPRTPEEERKGFHLPAG